MRRLNTHKTNQPVTFRFWSDSNQSNFERDLNDQGVLWDNEGKGVVLVYDDSEDVKNLGREYGADFF